MSNSEFDNQIIKRALTSSKIIAMVGVSSVKKEISSNIKRRPSVIVMKYLQEFGYKVIPVNPLAAGKAINGEKAISKLTDIENKIDIVNVFRPSKETPLIAKEAVRIKAKVLWLQYGIQNEEARKIAESSNINPVFPVLQ